MLLQPMPGTPSAPGFELSDLDGGSQSLDALAGRVLIVNFWATWCPPCRAEIPSMQRASELLGDDAVMIGVHVGGDADQIWTFLADMAVTFPVLIDKSGAVSRAWGTIGLPTTFVVDRQGRQVLRAIGERDWADPAILDQIRALARDDSAREAGAK
ncbi:MAG: TlpA family protein disulfide reductase [Hyphomicrobiaceae bacterium]